MRNNELIEFLQRQNNFLQGKLDDALASVSSLTLANEKLTATVDELRRQIASLEDVIKGKESEVSKTKAARQAVQRLQGSSWERQSKPTFTSDVKDNDDKKPEKNVQTTEQRERPIPNVRLKP